MTTNIPYFRPHKCRTQIRSVSCLIIIIIALNLQTNFLKPISITYIYYFELSSTPTISHSHCQFEQKHTNKHTHITVSERLVNNIYVLNSAAARKISKRRDTVCRRKLLPLSQGDDPEKKKALAHYNICSDDLDALQIFLPWSWSNCHPQPVLSSHPKAFNDPAYFPYNKYIFSRALLTEEERQESECRCFHFLPCPETRPADTWYDWPCGCRKKVCIIITSEVVEKFPRLSGHDRRNRLAKTSLHRLPLNPQPGRRGGPLHCSSSQHYVSCQKQKKEKIYFWSRIELDGQKALQDGTIQRQYLT